MRCVTHFTIFILYLYFNPTRGVDPSIQNYLLDRMRYVNEQFSRIKRSNGVHQQIQIDFADSHLVSFINTTEAHTFDLFNRNYLLSDGELFYVAPEDNKYILQSLKTFPEMRDEIAFIKTRDHNGIGYMFVAFVHDTVSHVYRFANDSLEPRMPIQTIKTINKLTDAQFFSNHGDLFLITSSVLGVSMAPVIVYKWEKSHFDDIDKVYVDGAIGLSSFPNLNSEIVIVLRNNELETSNSYVYEFEVNKLNKIQILDDIMSTHLLTFIHNNATFLVVFNDAPTSTLYRWFHNEFILLHQFEVQPQVQEVFLSIQDGVPLIATATKTDLMVFTLVTDTIQHLKTHQLEPSFNKILSIQFATFLNDTVVLLLGLTDDHNLNFMLIPMTLTKIDIVSSTQQSDQLLDCFEDLDDSITSYKLDVEVVEQDLDQRPTKTYEKLAMPPGLSHEDIEDVQAALRQQTPEVFLVNEQLEEDLNKTLTDLRLMEEKSHNLRHQLGEVLASNDVTIDGKVLIQGALNAEKLTSNSIRTKKLNGLTWEPESWISTSGDQHITTPLFIEHLKASDLEVHNDQGLFTDILSNSNGSSRNQTLSGVMRVGSLTARNIFAPQINDVDMRSLYLRRTPARITGNKSFNNVNVAVAVHATKLNGKNTSEAIKLFGDPKALQYEFLPLVTVKNLEVETINDIPWLDFSSKVFRLGSDQTIHGDLNVNNVKTQFLQPELIGGVRVEDLLTATTPQTVDSILHFRAVHAPNVQANTINGLDFKNDVATVAPNTLITGPVTLKTMRITGNLAINGSLDEFYKQNHIVGTHERDLLQIYNNKVRINGDLHVSDAELVETARLFINGNEFNQASFDDYWSKTTNQEIPVHFEAQNGISTPHLNTRLLNDIPLDDYMVNSNVPPTKRTEYVFENVTIIGNVIIDRAQHHQPDLQKLNIEAVRLNGTYELRGRKKFAGRISCENLKADRLNQIPTSDLLTQTASNVIGGKNIRNLTVQSINVNNLTMQQLNGIDLRELRARAVFIDQAAQLENVDFEAITANHLFAGTINNKLFNEYLVELNQLHLLKELNKLEIKGNASINKVDQVVYINHVNMPAIIEKMGGPNSIPGNLYIDGKVFVKELLVSNMNNIDVQRLVQDLFYRHWGQNVTAKHSFKYLYIPNLYTPQINNIRTTNLINVNTDHHQVLNVKHGLSLVNPRFKRSLFANVSGCNVQGAVGNIHDVPKRVWRSVVVENVTLTDNDNLLARLMNNAVDIKKDNIIAGLTSLNRVYADVVFNRKQINGIDLHRIVSDALTYNATDQVVTGVKEFTKLHAAAVGVEGTTQIPVVNGIDIMKLDNSIVDSSKLSLPIQGKKTFFGGVQTDRLTTPVAGGVMADNLVSLERLRPIPKATFDDLTVLNQLNIGMVNNVNFSHFLDDRLLLDAGHEQITTANYYFDALQLNGKTTIPSINDIELHDVVFDDEQDGEQVINVPKKFTQGLEVKGDAIIEVLNGYTVSDLYQNTILLQEEANIVGDMNLLAPSQITGDIRAKSINGFPFERILELLRSENHRVRIEIINDALHQIEGLVSHNTDMIKRMPNQYLYLERSEDIQIEVEHSHDAQVIKKKDGVIMHVHITEPGPTCGLPDGCDCQSQQTIKIQPEEFGNSSNPGKSYQFLDNKYAQRIYSYEDKDLVIDVITNTKSSSKRCSSNTTQEYTSVTWYTFPKSEAQGPKQGLGNVFSFPEHITGYISDVKFFALDGHVYIILAKLYDKTHDTAELDSLVLRISQDKTQVEHVHKLKTNGASTLHLFHTAQGVNLVVGNVGSGLFYETLTTDIYTFDRQVKMFQLLRLVPTTGCTSATSVVLGVDSLIIIAQKNSPMQVLKYNPFYQTYYFHETFLHDLPVSSVSVFYTAGFGRSDAYLTAVTDNGHFYIYSYHYLIGWKAESDGQMRGLTALIPLEIGKSQYLFAPSSSTTSTLLLVVKQGV